MHSLGQLIPPALSHTHKNIHTKTNIARINSSFNTTKSENPLTTVNVATWNVAAINNNPFEYWITHSDKQYNELMDAVQVGELKTNNTHAYTIGRA